jgi:hypothetical protein
MCHDLCSVVGSLCIDLVSHLGDPRLNLSVFSSAPPSCNCGLSSVRCACEVRFINVQDDLHVQVK